MKTLTILLVISIYCFSQNDSTIQIDAEIIRCFIQPDSSTQIIGGLESLQDRLQYPSSALEKGIDGTVFVVLTIDTSGTPTNPKILKGLGYGCDEEAKRLVTTSNYFPAILHGKKIKSQFMIPIKFKLPTE